MLLIGLAGLWVAIRTGYHPTCSYSQSAAMLCLANRPGPNHTSSSRTEDTASDTLLASPSIIPTSAENASHTRRNPGHETEGRSSCHEQRHLMSINVLNVIPDRSSERLVNTPSPMRSDFAGNSSSTSVSEGGASSGIQVTRSRDASARSSPRFVDPHFNMPGTP